MFYFVIHVPFIYFSLKIIDDLSRRCDKLQEIEDNGKILKMRHEECLLQVHHCKKQIETGKITIEALKDAEKPKTQDKSLVEDLKHEQGRRIYLEEVHRNASAAILEVLLVFCFAFSASHLMPCYSGLLLQVTFLTFRLTIRIRQ